MNIRPIRILLLAAFAGSLSLAACDEEDNGNMGAPDAHDGDRLEKREDNLQPGDARPGDPNRTVGADGHLVRPPDNTANNKGDANDEAKTPFDQSENAADIKTTAEIRKAILRMDGMSTNADNVKIMTSNGVVAIRGVVESQSEIDAITKIVSEAPGVTSTDIVLTVDPD